MDPTKKSEEFNHDRRRFVGSAQLKMICLLVHGVGVGPCGNLPCPGAPADFPANVQGLWI